MAIVTTLWLVSVLGAEPLTDEELIANLASNSYDIREEAESTLIKKMTPLLYVKMRDLPDGEYEVTSRKKTIALHYRRHLVQQVRLDFRGYDKYPLIDQSLPDFYTLDRGPWKGWKRHEFANHYVLLVNDDDREYCCCCGTEDCFLGRKAMEIWIKERISFEIQDALKTAVSGEDLVRRTKEGISFIQKDLDLFIEADREYTRQHHPCYLHFHLHHN